MLGLLPLLPADVPDLRAFLTRVDLTLSGLDDPTVRLWLLRGPDGQVQGSTGYEVSESGCDVLIRSVAVDPALRGSGLGLRLAQSALDDAERAGAGRAWLFSRRSGPFWQRLGFSPADRDDLAVVLQDTHQVRHFEETGQLHREVAWSRPLRGADLPWRPAPGPARPSRSARHGRACRPAAARRLRPDSAVAVRPGGRGGHAWDVRLTRPTAYNTRAASAPGRPRCPADDLQVL